MHMWVFIGTQNRNMIPLPCCVHACGSCKISFSVPLIRRFVCVCVSMCHLRSWRKRPRLKFNKTHSGYAYS